MSSKSPLVIQSVGVHLLIRKLEFAITGNFGSESIHLNTGARLCCGRPLLKSYSLRMTDSKLPKFERMPPHEDSWLMEGSIDDDLKRSKINI